MSLGRVRPHGYTLVFPDWVALTAHCTPSGNVSMAMAIGYSTSSTQEHSLTVGKAGSLKNRLKGWEQFKAAHVKCQTA